MGLFQRKQQAQPDDNEAQGNEQHFFDEYFREELRNRGRWYFEEIINKNGELFKQDLDATVAKVNAELKAMVTSQVEGMMAQVNTQIKEHVTRQLDEQFVEYGKAMKEAQDAALQSLSSSAEALNQQHQQLSATLQKNIEDQDRSLNGLFQENMQRMQAMKEAQDAALQSLSSSAEALNQQHQQLSITLQKSIENQERIMVDAFQENMAQIIEHYLLGALGEQYDMKAQLPSIVKQLEENKQAIVDDMKL